MKRRRLLIMGLLVNLLVLLSFTVFVIALDDHDEDTPERVEFEYPTMQIAVSAGVPEPSINIIERELGRCRNWLNSVWWRHDVIPPVYGKVVLLYPRRNGVW